VNKGGNNRDIYIYTCDLYKSDFVCVCVCVCEKVRFRYCESREVSKCTSHQLSIER
jgi:hypothetical protein